MNVQYRISQINVYPVKSLPGISVKKAVIEERGIKNDRRWLLVDNDNSFITQRSFPNMVFINVDIIDNNLIFNHRKGEIEELSISISDIPESEVKVQIWDDFCTARIYKDEINDWFSTAIGSKCSLVYMPNSTNRKTSTKYYHKSKNVSFADGYPYLIIGEQSLNNLNDKLINKVKMSQFRPNLVFKGGIKHDEDNWNEILIGKIKFAVVKPCARCVVTTIDPTDGSKNKEPLATLNGYRNFSGKIMFGQNAIALSEGRVKLEDTIQILK